MSISTIVGKLKGNYKPLIVAVFLAIGGFAANSLFVTKTGVIEERGILGGPAIVESASAQTGALLEIDQSPAIGLGDTFGSGGDVVIATNVVTEEGALKDLGESAGPAIGRSGLISYTVQKGDNLSRIASYFGVSVDTVVSANPGVRATLLKAGQELKILPTSGVVYETKGGDTIESISSSFGIPQEKIKQFNPSVNFANIDPGVPIIIPGGKTFNRFASTGNGLPDYGGNFIAPAKGYDWGILHHYNAVDIANSCGTPVVASAEGLVVPDESIPDGTDGWNGGYGNFVLIEHPFGDHVRTRYAHLEKIMVQVGDYVEQGQEIGLMGESGEATGCHVHFEVYGAKNPFAKQ